MGNLQIGDQFKVKNASSPGLSLRKEAITRDETKNILVSIPNGAKVRLQSTFVKIVDKRTWYNVKYTDNDRKELKGWVASDYLEELQPRSSSSLPSLHWSQFEFGYDDLEKDERNGIYPCDKKVFKDQCAIRLGTALAEILPELEYFQGARCGLKDHGPYHILRAQELANWLRTQTSYVGRVKIYKEVTAEDFKDKRGLLFIQKPTGAGGLDHIDLWDGQKLKTREIKDNSWISACQQVWFWDLWPGIVKTEGDDVSVYSGDFAPDRLKPPVGSIKAKTNRPIDVYGANDGFFQVDISQFYDRTNKEDGLGWIESRFIVAPNQPLDAPTKGKVTVSSLQIRQDHSTGSPTVAGVAALRKGEEVTIKEIWSDGKDTWALRDTGGWVAIEKSNGETLETFIEGVF